LPTLVFGVGFAATGGDGIPTTGGQRTGGGYDFALLTGGAQQGE